MGGSAPSSFEAWVCEREGERRFEIVCVRGRDGGRQKERVREKHRERDGGRGSV